MSETPKVYAAIAAVSAELAKTGISKDRKNQQQGYNFRGIDEVFNALAPLLAKHALVILPRILGRECVERTAKSGSAQFYVTVDAEFDYVCAADGSKHTVRTFGEAQDSGDKATNKAMSAAYKYAAFQTFCIPTEGDNDADATTPEPVQPKPRVQTITEDQRIELGDIAKEHGWHIDDVRKLLRERFKVTNSMELPASQYEAMKAALRAKVKAA